MSFWIGSRNEVKSEVARIGYEAMMKGEGDVVAGWSNNLRAAISNIMPSGVSAEQQRKLAEPGSAYKR